MDDSDVSLKMIIDEFRQNLVDKYGQEEVMQFLYLLFEELKGWNKADVHLKYQTFLKGNEVTRLRDILSQLKNNRPIQYIIGSTQFLNTLLKVKEGVLIPRPETEELVLLILNDFDYQKAESLSLLDIGTGSGCIAIALKKQIPELAVTALDFYQEALKVANINSKLNNCRINFLLSDILDKPNWKDFHEYDIIVSNPPYVTENERSSMHPNVLEYEPFEALFVTDEDPLKFYSSITEFSFLHLKRPGSLYLEINERFGTRIKAHILSKGFNSAEVLKDLNGKDRFIRARLSF